MGRSVFLTGMGPAANVSVMYNSSNAVFLGFKTIVLEPHDL